MMQIKVIVTSVMEIFEERYLQVDHRVPYEISGDDDNFQQNINQLYAFMCFM